MPKDFVKEGNRYAELFYKSQRTCADLIEMEEIIYSVAVERYGCFPERTRIQEVIRVQSKRSQIGRHSISARLLSSNTENVGQKDKFRVEELAYSPVISS